MRLGDEEGERHTRQPTSSADWPQQWGKDYQVVFGLFQRVFVRKDGMVARLYSRTHGLAEFGSVPLDIDPAVLVKLLPLMLNAYERGREDGRRDLARKLQAPINDALRDADD